MVKNVISVEQNRFQLLFLALNQQYTEGSFLLHAIFSIPILNYLGKAGGLQILRWQGFAVKRYGFTLAALTLEPSDFCNNGANDTCAILKRRI